MDKRQKTILVAAVGVFAAIVALIVVLIVSNARHAGAAASAEARVDSLQLANEQLALTNEFERISNEFSQYEDQQIYLKNDSLVQKYNQARLKVEGLIKELNAEKRSNDQNRARIRQLEGEIATLKGIVRHYLEELTRLSEENTGLKKELAEVNTRNEELQTQITSANSRNEELAQTVKIAKKLSITNLSLQGYKDNGKAEPKIGKAKKLGVSFTVSPNQAVSPGMKDFYVRIVTPEGTLLGDGRSISYDGGSVATSASRSVEYGNDEVHVSVYCPASGATLTKGEYKVEVFCDGYRLASRTFGMTK